MISIKTKSAKEKESRIKGEGKYEKDEEDMMEEKWRAESDARTLVEAEAIKADKPRFARAQAVAKKQAEAFAKVVK